jgi:glutamyl/glutaminyl-tRNA synthetase
MEEKRLSTPNLPKVTSRYADIKDVRIDSEKVPQALRQLLSLAKYWSIGDDVERLAVMRVTEKEELSSLVEAIQSFENEIWEWCSSHHSDIPVPDEVIVFDRLLQAAAEARQMLKQP